MKRLGRMKLHEKVGVGAGRRQTERMCRQLIKIQGLELRGG